MSWLSTWVSLLAEIEASPGLGAITDTAALPAFFLLQLSFPYVFHVEYIFWRLFYGLERLQLDGLLLSKKLIDSKFENMPFLNAIFNEVEHKTYRFMQHCYFRIHILSDKDSIIFLIRFIHILLISVCPIDVLLLTKTFSRKREAYTYHMAFSNSCSSANIWN